MAVERYQQLRDSVRAAVRESVQQRRDRRASELVDGEAESIEHFLAAFDALNDPLSESADPVHVTGSAIVVGPLGVVLLRHKRLGMWLQPGGHLNPGETPWDAALREAAEETGLALELASRELVHVDVHPGGRGHTHLDLRYLVRPVAGSDTSPRPPTDESQEVYWFEWNEAIGRASDDRLRSLLSALAPAGTSDAMGR